MATIHVSDFIRDRQTERSGMSHFKLYDNSTADENWNCLRQMVQNNFDAGHYVPGYRDGVVLVEMDPTRFYCGITALRKGDLLIGKYESRSAREAPRKSLSVPNKGAKLPAKSVKIVLYRVDVLQENGEQEGHNAVGDWLIISINASPTDNDVPMTPDTMMYNFFKESGGTDTRMNNDQFVESLAESFSFWKDKALIWNPN